MAGFCKFEIGQTVSHTDIIGEFQCGNMGECVGQKQQTL